MGNDEEGKSSKSDKSSSPAPAVSLGTQDQNNTHVYPDWAAMQAYYGPRVPLPPYYNSAMASGHAPHGPHGPPPYMWGPPQPMMSPYGAPYAAIYSHGGVYAHPAIPLGSSPGQGVPSSPAIVPPLSMEAPTKSTGNSDQGLMKKLKRFDGLAMSIGNGNAETAEGGDGRGLSHSMETNEGSSDGSNGNTSAADQSGRKRNCKEIPTIEIDAAGKTETRASPAPAEKAHTAPNKVLGGTVFPVSIPGKSVGSVLSPGKITKVEPRNLPLMNVATSPTTFPQSGSVLPPETWLQNEREQKRERRKQSNRESARRSRLRKQAETEELAKKVESLTAENVALKSEINRLMENSGKLRLQNSTFMEKLKNAQLGKDEELAMNKVDDNRAEPISTVNLLSRVNNPGSAERSHGEKGDRYDKNSGTKLHQLMDANPRADAVAAG